MLKEIRRYNSRKTFVFQAEVTVGLWCVGLHDPPRPTIFFNSFFAEPKNRLAEDALTRLLFAAAVLPPFFRNNTVYEVMNCDVSALVKPELPQYAIVPHMNADKPAGQPAWEGEYTYKGGALYRLPEDRNPLNYLLESDSAIIENLDVTQHRDEILSSPIAIGAVDADLRERLFLCAQLGKDIDPLKAMLFPDHPDLQAPKLAQSHYHFKHQMPLLGLRFDPKSSAWIDETS